MVIFLQHCGYLWHFILHLGFMACWNRCHISPCSLPWYPSPCVQWGVSCLIHLFVLHPAWQSARDLTEQCCLQHEEPTWLLWDPCLLSRAIEEIPIVFIACYGFQVRKGWKVWPSLPYGQYTNHYIVLLMMLEALHPWGISLCLR